MSEKFEFNTEVYLDGERLVPSQINVAKNKDGVLVEHMGDNTVNGQDIYNIPVNDTTVIIMASGDTVVKLRSEDLKENQHVATLTVAHSKIDGIKIRGNNVVISIDEMKNVSMRDSQVVWTTPGTRAMAAIENFILENTSLKDVVIGVPERDPQGVYNVLESCEITDSYISSFMPMKMKACCLKRSTVRSFAGSVDLAYAYIECVHLEFENDLKINTGHWSEFQACRGFSMDIRGIFEMTKIETPDAPFYFYHAGGGIYCVSSHKGYRHAWVDPSQKEPFVDQLRKLVYDKDKVSQTDYTDYQESVVQFVRDAVVSRLRVIEQLQKIAASKARGTKSGQEKEGGSS